MISIYSSIRETLIPSCSFFSNLRCSLSTTAMLCRGSRSGKHRPTRMRTKPLTYEMSVTPHLIGVRKSWLTWHTSQSYSLFIHIRVQWRRGGGRMPKGPWGIVGPYGLYKHGTVNFNVFSFAVYFKVIWKSLGLVNICEWLKMKWFDAWYVELCITCSLQK